MTDLDEIEIRGIPSEEFRWVLIHPYEGVLYFRAQDERDAYATESVLDMEGDRRLDLMCCAEIDTLFMENAHVH